MNPDAHAVVKVNGDTWTKLPWTALVEIVCIPSYGLRDHNGDGGDGHAPTLPLKSGGDDHTLSVRMHCVPLRKDHMRGNGSGAVIQRVRKEACIMQSVLVPPNADDVCSPRRAIRAENNESMLVTPNLIITTQIPRMNGNAKCLSLWPNA